MRINRIRVGLDPVRSASIFFKEKDFYNNKFFFNTWEVNAEVIGPYRTSIIAEFGFTKTHLQILNGTMDYFSKGYYAKVGLDFNLTEEDSRFELDLGWRVGYGDYNESAEVKIEGHYWDNTVKKYYPEKHRVANWGEIILNQKVRMFYNNQDLNDLYFGVAVRMKFMNDLSNADGIYSLLVPGYGPGGSFSPAVTFSLSYQFNIKRSVIKQLLHKHDNDFVPKKD